MRRFVQCAVLVVAAGALQLSERQNEVRLMLANWYHNFTASHSDSHEAVPLLAVHGVPVLADSQEKAVALVEESSSPVKGLISENAREDEYESVKRPSAHMCTGARKDQCLITNVCFSVDGKTDNPGTASGQEHIETSNNSVDMQFYAALDTETGRGRERQTRKVLESALQRWSMAPKGPQGAAAINFEIMPLPSTSRDSRVSGGGEEVGQRCAGGYSGVAVLLRAEARCAGAHALLSDVLSAFSLLLDFDVLRSGAGWGRRRKRGSLSRILYARLRARGGVQREKWGKDEREIWGLLEHYQCACVRMRVCASVCAHL